MAKIAIDLERALRDRALNGTPGGIAPRMIARGDGWTVADVICTSGPQDRPFEEQHSHVSLAIVAAGSFQYRSPLGRALMMPGSMMLGNAGHCFECGHEHGAGDRCVSFWFSVDYFERLAADAGLRGGRACFTIARLPPVRAMSPLVARACAGVVTPTNAPWEELAVELAVRALQVVSGIPPGPVSSPRGAEARVTDAVRRIETQPDSAQTLGSLARDASLSPFHFLRTFERLTGVTPHQYVLRARLREAAIRLSVESSSVLDVALDCGFGDVSNFNRAFRAEFGVTPRAFRAARLLPRSEHA